MARRGLTGQLNMFDFFSSLEDQPMGEVEMVSLMPGFEEEILEPEPEPLVLKEAEPEPEPTVVEEVESEPEIMEAQRKADVERSIDGDSVVMSRKYEVDGQAYEISYLNYNKVRICKGEEESQIHVFASSKEAVDYYVKRMQEMEADE